MEILDFVQVLGESAGSVQKCLKDGIQHLA